MQGWIKLYRQIQESFIWCDDEPFCRRGAWIDLLLLVNHENKRVIFNGKFIEVKRGQRITSVRKLADRWGWSTKKTISFLNLLEDEKMIVRESDNKKTLLTIVNYDFYQDCGNTEETQKKHRRNAEETQKTHRLHTNKNDKNEKNEENEKKDTIRETAQRIIDNYHLQCPSLPRVIKLTDKRIKAVNARLKEYTEEDLEKAFIKAELSDFLSGRKTDWNCDFDWLMNPNNIVKVLDGNYDNKNETKKLDDYLEKWAKVEDNGESGVFGFS